MDRKNVQVTKRLMICISDLIETDLTKTSMHHRHNNVDQLRNTTRIAKELELGLQGLQ